MKIEMNSNRQWFTAHNQRFVGLRTGAIGAILALSVAQVAQADTHYVALEGGNMAPYTTLENAATSIQAAVDAASDGDTVLVADGTYAITQQIEVHKGITLLSANGYKQTTVISEQDSIERRCIYLNHTDAVVDGFTVTGGYSRFDRYDYTYFPELTHGTGIYSETGGTIRNCLLTGNTAAFGGAGICLAYRGLIEDCIVSNNSCGTAGGSVGICSMDHGVVKNCLVTRNYTREDYANGGGGIGMENGGLIDGCEIIGNGAFGKGGGVSLRNGATLRNSIITGNGSYDFGGGVASFGGYIENCLITDNRTDSGGWFMSIGGGVYGENTMISACTIAGNEGGIKGDIILANSIVHNNYKEAMLQDDGTLLSSGYEGNYYFDDRPSFYHCATYPMPGIGSGNIEEDPLFSSAGDYSLLPGSPCINAGFNEEWMYHSTDLYGNDRIIGHSVDMGAVEMGSGTPEDRIGIYSPANGATFSAGEDVSAVALAVDKDGIRKVTFYLDGVWQARYRDAPYTHVYENLPVGTHELRVYMMDDNGEWSSDMITINVQ